VGFVFRRGILRIGPTHLLSEQVVGERTASGMLNLRLDHVDRLTVDPDLHELACQLQDA